MSNEEAVVIGRDYDPETDQAFIFSTWRKGLYYGSTHRDTLPNAFNFMRYQTEKIKKMLPHAQVRVACLKDDPSLILGYAVFTGDQHLEWVFVKSNFRSKKIGTFLTVNVKTVSKDMTKAGLEIAQKKNLVIKENEDESSN